jgi:hypothetical protein
MIQNDTKSLVPIIYFDMFSLRLLGWTYAQIAAKTGYSESHVRRLFAKDGAMHEIWLDFQQKAKESGIDEAYTMMFGNLPDIIRNLIEIAKTPDRSAIEASKMILSYTMGKPPEKVNLQVQQPETLADMIKFEMKRDQITNAFRNFGLISQKDESAEPETLS